MLSFSNKISSALHSLQIGGERQSRLKHERERAFKHVLQVRVAVDWPVHARHLRWSPFWIWLDENSRKVFSDRHFEQHYLWHPRHTVWPGLMLNWFLLQTVHVWRGLIRSIEEVVSIDIERAVCEESESIGKWTRLVDELCATYSAVGHWLRRSTRSIHTLHILLPLIDQGTFYRCVKILAFLTKYDWLVQFLTFLEFTIRTSPNCTP